MQIPNSFKYTITSKYDEHFYFGNFKLPYVVLSALCKM